MKENESVQSEAKKGLIWNLLGRITAPLLGVLMLGIGYAIWAKTHMVESGLDIVAGIERATTNSASNGESKPPGPEPAWAVSGRVLDDGEPVPHAWVWCVVRDDAGNRFAPSSASADMQGQFRIDGIPTSLGKPERPLAEIRISARQSMTNWLGRSAKKGESVISPFGLARQANVMDSNLWPCTLLFFGISIFVGLLIQVVRVSWRRHLYFMSVLTALALTVTMLGAIAGAYMKVKTSVTQGQTWSIGFISIFEATYVKDFPKQWLISLTGPPDDSLPLSPENKNDRAYLDGISLTQRTGQIQSNLPPVLLTQVIAPPIQGLGAPMWVVFLAVIGAALSTVAVIVNEIKTPPDFDTTEPAELRERLLGLVQNQFFMLFAPLGGIFIYQALVLAGAAAQPFVVAIAALGAGATLNILLAVALTKASAALMPESQKAKASAGG